MTTEDWFSVLAREPVTDLGLLKDRLTNHPEIQAWLPSASIRSVEGLEDMDEASMSAYAFGNLMADLEAAFPELVQAVRRLTGGCGKLTIHWRPSDPQYSTLGLEFGTAHDVHLLRNVSNERGIERAIVEFLNVLADKVPPGMPARGRPDRATGLVVRKDHCVYVEFKVENTGRDVSRSASIRTAYERKSEAVTQENIVERIVERLETG